MYICIYKIIHTVIIFGAISFVELKIKYLSVRLIIFRQNVELYRLLHKKNVQKVHAYL